MTERLEWHRGVRGEIAPGRFDEHQAHEAVLAAGIEPIRLFQIRLPRYSLPANAASTRWPCRDLLRICRDRREQDLVHQQGPERAVVQNIDVGRKNVWKLRISKLSTLSK